MGVIGLIKIGANIALGIGNQAIISSLTKQLISDNSSKAIRICARFASTTLAGVATAACSKNVNETIDQMATIVEALKNGAKSTETKPQEA